jgi:hypothetical protein
MKQTSVLQYFLKFSVNFLNEILSITSTSALSATLLETNETSRLDCNVVKLHLLLTILQL